MNMSEILTGCVLPALANCISNPVEIEGFNRVGFEAVKRSILIAALARFDNDRIFCHGVNKAILLIYAAAIISSEMFQQFGFSYPV